MKKLFLLFALAGVMVACDDKKKDDNKADKQIESNAPISKPDVKVEPVVEGVPQTATEVVEQKSAVDYLEAQIKVMEADDVEGYVAIAEEMYTWQNGLSSDELAAQKREAEKWFETNRSKYISVSQQFTMKNEAALAKALQNSNLPL